MRAMQTRAAEAVREWNARVERDHGPDAVYLMCSHGDIIKSLVADALGLHLDLFQRIHVDPLLRHRDPLHPAAALPGPPRRHRRPLLAGAPKEPRGDDATVGGGAGAP
ncbi:hypothetical protein Sdagh_14380 [Streptomyces daghestanicus]|uniref:Phosphoglycerate mutase n=1 Tax=Streptomyces daghestanicus TaxID=66885 RepID=A0ABQ3PXF7_9ACTN|nr:hypothetical protein Sdagh_14380 [Streptomyces daghestanicus]